MFKSGYIYFLSLFVSLSLSAFAQEKGSQIPLIQFSGVVVTSDSLKPVPFVTVIIKHTNRGTLSDFYGFFSFVARLGDTVEFSSVGYKKARYILPDTLRENRYSLIQMLNRDTIMLKETIIYPWPTREQFKEAFMNLKVPDDDLERAKRNLARAERKDRLEEFKMDGNMNQKYYMEQKMNQLYYAGQLPPNNLLNPIAWAKFIQAWKNGDFKRKNKDKEQD